MAFMLTPEDEAQANALVIDLMQETKCLAALRGADLATLTSRIAGVICSARSRAHRAALAPRDANDNRQTHSVWPGGKFALQGLENSPDGVALFLCSSDDVPSNQVALAMGEQRLYWDVLGSATVFFTSRADARTVVATVEELTAKCKVVKVTVGAGAPLGPS